MSFLKAAGIRIHREFVGEGAQQATRFELRLPGPPPPAVAVGTPEVRAGQIAAVFVFKAHRVREVPSATLGLQVRFEPEGFVERVSKLFTREVQAGDPRFDEGVFVKTESPVTTARLLARPDVRALISAVVEEGYVELNGKTLVVQLAGRHTDDPPVLLKLVRALLDARDAGALEL